MEVILQSLDRKVRLETDIDDVYKYVTENDFVSETIPAFSVTKDKNKVDFTVTVRKSDASKVMINFDKKTCDISINKKEIYQPDLVYLILQIFCRLHEENNTYLIHASCINYMDNGIVLAGESGSGKTGVAFSLLNKGAKYIANDRALIRDVKGVPFVVGGTANMHVRIPTIKQFLKKDIKGLKTGGKIDWNEKILLTKEQLKDLGFEQGEQARIRLILFPKIIMGAEKNTFFEQENEKKKVLDLYQAFSQQIRASSNVFLTIDWPFISLDTSDLAQKRLDMVHKLIDTSKIVTATGNVDGITDEIVRMLKN